MKSIRIKNIGALLVCIVMLISCEDLSEINQNPNSITSIPDQYLFTNMCKYTVSEARQLIARSQVFFCGTWSHLYSSGYPEDRYRINTDTDDESIVWQDLYSITSLGIAADLKNKLGPEGANPNEVKYAMVDIVAFIKILKITDLFGDVPYTEAGKGVEGILLPKYDTQESIYKDIIEKLGNYITVFEGATTADGFGTADPFYAGDMSKWIKFANSLRLRLAMRMRYADPSGAQTAITACLAKPLMTSNNDNARILNFNTTVVYQYSGWYEAYVNEGSFRLSKFLVDKMNASSDPRLPIFALQNSLGGYEGYPNGLTSEARTSYDATNVSVTAPILYAKDIPSYCLTFSEVCFLKAEAALYNLGGTNPNTHYQNGITAAMLQWGVSQAAIDTYLTDEPEASLTGTTEDDFRKICTQLWMSCISNNYEAYNVVRRTGYPVIPVRTGLETPQLDVGLTNGTLPRRIQYPTTEINLNKANYDEAVARQGADLMTTRIWWDAK
jgi:hypothetical protein